MKRIAIIPARGGSKRIPKKNIKNFLGKPIIAYSIKAAIDSELFDTVMVSTDDEEIADISRYYGAEVPFIRSTENSDDFATTFDVIEEVFAEYRILQESFEIGCCIYATAPFVNAKMLEQSLQVLEGGFDCVFPVLQYSFPIQRSVKFDSLGRILMLYPQELNSRSQDLEKAFHDSGQFYWFNTNEILRKKALLTNNSSAIVVGELQAHDIDTDEDWRVAEFKFEMIHGREA